MVQNDALQHKVDYPDPGLGPASVSTNCATQAVFWPFYNKKLKLFILVLSQTDRQAIYLKNHNSRPLVLTPLKYHVLFENFTENGVFAP